MNSHTHKDLDEQELRQDLRLAHVGLIVVVIASVVVGAFAGLVYGLLVAGAFLTVFVIALVVQCLAGFERAAVLRAYVVTFGWAQWL
jgi:hypothetical protein